MRIYNENYHQFPNYVLRLELSKDTYNEIMTTKYLFIIVSLLVNYFTIYYQEEFVFQSFLPENHLQFPKKIILYGKNKGKNTEKDLLSLQKIVTKYYSDYNFVPHNLLFSHKIYGGLPHGEDFETIKEKYTLYQYLFGHYYFLDITEILD